MAVAVKVETIAGAVRKGGRGRKVGGGYYSVPTRPTPTVRNKKDGKIHNHVTIIFNGWSR